MRVPQVKKEKNTKRRESSKPRERREQNAESFKASEKSARRGAKNFTR